MTDEVPREFETDAYVELDGGVVLPSRLWEAEVGVRAAAWVAACQGVACGLTGAMDLAFGPFPPVALAPWVLALGGPALAASGVLLLARRLRRRWLLVLRMAGQHLLCLSLVARVAVFRFPSRPGEPVVYLPFAFWAATALTLGLYALMATGTRRGRSVFDPRWGDRPLAPLREAHLVASSVRVRIAQGMSVLGFFWSMAWAILGPSYLVV